MTTTQRISSPQARSSSMGPATDALKRALFVFWWTCSRARTRAQPQSSGCRSFQKYFLRSCSFLKTMMCAWLFVPQAYTAASLLLAVVTTVAAVTGSRWKPGQAKADAPLTLAAATFRDSCSCLAASTDNPRRTGICCVPAAFSQHALTF